MAHGLPGHLFLQVSRCYIPGCLHLSPLPIPSYAGQKAEPAGLIETISMTSFTVHSIPWQAAAPLLQDLRRAAGWGAACADELDGQCRHAIALSGEGRAIGCARMTPGGVIERVTIIPDERHALIEAALIEALKA